MVDKLLVSVIIPTYNRAHLIIETLNSVLNQTYKNWECIVVDDGSEDNTEEIVENYAVLNTGFQYAVRTDEYLKGGNGARNYGVMKSKGNLLVFLDSDDVLSVSSLENRVKAFVSCNSDILLSHTGTFRKVLGDSDIIWNKIGDVNDITQLIDRFIRMDMPWHTNGVTWRKDFFDKTGGWDESLRAWQDWELHCRSLFYKPAICVMGADIDNYFRTSKHHSIGKTADSKQYMMSVLYSFISINSLLIKDEMIFKAVKVNYHKLIFKMLIHFPVKRRFFFFPISVLNQSPFFKGVNTWSFFRFYIKELLMKSYKIRRFIMRKSYLEHQTYMELKSNYLKYKINDL